jgi:drug/metabolite transporter (DMT)-like permease
MNPVFALIITNAIWGAAAPIYKLGLQNMPPSTFLFLRFFFASLIFYPAVRKEHFSEISKKDWAFIVAATFFGFTIQIGFLLLGLQKTQSINSSIILIGSPILLFFLAIIFLHEKAHLKVLLGIIISTVGVLFVIFSPLLLGQNMHLALSEFQGNLLYVGALVADVISILLYKGVSKKISPYTLTFLSFAISTVTFFPLMLPELKTWSFMYLDFHGLISLLYAIFFSSAIAYYLYFYGLQKIDGEEIGIFGYINPVFTVLVAIPLLHEVPTFYFIVGSVLIVIGLCVSQLKHHRPHLPHK